MLADHGLTWVWHLTRFRRVQSLALDFDVAHEGHVWGIWFVAQLPALGARYHAGIVTENGHTLPTETVPASDNDTRLELAFCGVLLTTSRAFHGDSVTFIPSRRFMVLLSSATVNDPPAPSNLVWGQEAGRGNFSVSIATEKHLIKTQGKMSMHTFPFLYINLGGEMLYILKQRLEAQNVSLEKKARGKNLFM